MVLPSYNGLNTEERRVRTQQIHARLCALLKEDPPYLNGSFKLNASAAHDTNLEYQFSKKDLAYLKTVIPQNKIVLIDVVKYFDNALRMLSQYQNQSVQSVVAPRTVFGPKLPVKQYQSNIEENVA